MAKQWAKQMLLYISKVYDLGGMLKSAFDERPRPQIQPAAVFFSVLLGFLLRMSSLEQLERWCRSGRFQKLVPRGMRLPSVDTIRRALSGFDITGLRWMNDQLIQKARTNRVLRSGTVDRFVVAAIDGVELFSSLKQGCSECLQRTHKGVTEYFHRAVVCSVVGRDPRLVLDVEMLGRADGSQKNEGEQTGAYRLMERMYRELHHFADVLVFDALFVSAPLMGRVRKIGMDFVIRVKQERYEFVQDALGLMRGREPDTTFVVGDEKRHRTIRVKAWQEVGLQWQDLPFTLRFIRYEQEITFWRCEGKRKIQVTEIHPMWVVTTLLPDVALMQVVWEMMHRRWDLENCGFHQLKTYVHLDHCFVHDTTAIEANLRIMVLAYNLFQLFLFRNVRGFRALDIPQCAVVEEMWKGILTIRKSLAVVLWQGS